MLETFVRLLTRKKLTPEEREEARKKEMMAAVNAHLEGGETISEGLGALQLSDLSNSLGKALQMLNPAMDVNGIPEEKLGLYRDIVSGLQRELGEAALSDQDTKVIDALIAALVTYFGNAVRRGNEATADRILVSISDGIQYSRAPFRETTPERTAAELRKREERMETVVALAELRDVSDQIDAGIREIEESIARMSAELELVKEEARTFVESREDAKEILSIYRNTGEMTDKVFITQFAKVQNRVIHAKSDLDKLVLIREHKEMNRDKMDRVRSLMKIADYMKDEAITQEALARVTHILEQSKDAVAREEAQKKIVDEIERKAEAIFDVMEENMIPEIDSIISEYEKMERSDRKAMEAIKKEKQRQADQKLRTETDSSTDREKKVIVE